MHFIVNSSFLCEFSEAKMNSNAYFLLGAEKARVP